MRFRLGDQQDLVPDDHDQPRLQHDAVLDPFLVPNRTAKAIEQEVMQRECSTISADKDLGNHHVVRDGGHGEHKLISAIIPEESIGTNPSMSHDTYCTQHHRPRIVNRNARPCMDNQTKETKLIKDLERPRQPHQTSLSWKWKLTSRGRRRLVLTNSASPGGRSFLELPVNML